MRAGPGGRQPGRPGPCHGGAPTFGPTQAVQGTPLVLQGAGTRYRAVFKVYDMALYLPRKVRTAEEILATTGPMRLDFVAQRDIPGTDLGLSFIKGLSANATPDQIRRHTPSSNRLVEIFSGRTKLASGDTFAMEFVPGKGTTFYIQGQAQGAPVGDAEYFGMVLRIWLGASPVDSQLKDALLSAGTN
ncbi:chalcone isomerase family protein [Acidovorax sp. LjRoot66]|uniref:chalcone isomerase family protein n=1 Tax=Acidovorax sp. LjRoot66 TaxID=3342334 RepID=UPI003ECD8498